MNLRYVVFLASTAATGGLLFGFDVAIISGAGPFLARHFELEDFGLGFAFSSLLFGCVAGSAIAGRLSDRYGRRRILLWIAALFALTSVATGLAWGFHSFLAARFFGGLAVGAVSLISPVYIAEIAPASVRGRMSALYQLSIVTGILASYCINYLLRDLGPDNWRWMFMTGVLPPELSGGSAVSASERRRSWSALLKGDARRAVFVGFWLAILVHFSGINTVIDYCTGDLSIGRLAAGRGPAVDVRRRRHELPFHVGILLDHRSLRRRPIYIAGSLGMAAALVALTAAVKFGHFHGPLVLNRHGR